MCQHVSTLSHLAGQTIDAHQDDHEHGQQKGAEVEDIRARGDLSDENHDHGESLTGGNGWGNHICGLWGL